MLTHEIFPTGVILIKDDKGNKMRYIGYTLTEAKKRFKKKFYAHNINE